VPTEAERAYDQGRRDQRISALEDHAEKVTHDIQRGAEATERVERKVDGLVTKVNTADAVGKALAASATSAIEHTVTQRQLAVGLLMAVATIGLLVVGAFALLH
jgi:hypothetical protein